MRTGLISELGLSWRGRVEFVGDIVGELVAAFVAGIELDGLCLISGAVTD